MASLLWNFAGDVKNGFSDCIGGLLFLKDLDKDAERVAVNEVTLTTPKTILQVRREREGIVHKPAEPIFRHREGVWKRIAQCVCVNFVIIASVKLLSVILTTLIKLVFNDFNGEWLSAVIILPVFLLSRLVLAFWFSDIAGACLRQKKLRDVPPVDFRIMTADILASTVLGIVFFIQTLLTEYIPIRFLSSAVTFVHLCLLNSMYSFEYFWSSRNVRLQERISRIENHWPYFVGYGMPLTLTTFFTSGVMLNGCIFAAAFPFSIISTYNATWDFKKSSDVPRVNFFVPSMLVTDKISKSIAAFTKREFERQTSQGMSTQ